MQACLGRSTAARCQRFSVRLRNLTIIKRPSRDGLLRTDHLFCPSLFGLWHVLRFSDAPGTTSFAAAPPIFLSRRRGLFLNCAKEVVRRTRFVQPHFSDLRSPLAHQNSSIRGPRRQNG